MSRRVLAPCGRFVGLVEIKARDSFCATYLCLLNEGDLKSLGEKNNQVDICLGDLAYLAWA